MELDLGLGIGATSPVSTRPRRVQEQKQPTLTLSLSDEVHGGGTAHPRVMEEGRQTWPSSPHSTVSSFSTVYSEPLVKMEKELGCSEEVEEVIKAAAASRVGGYDDNDGGARKKLRLTKEQSAMLEDKFKEHSTLSPKQKHALAKQLNLRPRQVEVWFQNRRARTKLKQTEVDCELLKKCCESLTDENRRLHKELQELKSLKLAPPPPVYMQFPAATLTMCPSCNTIAGGSADGTPKAGGTAESFAVTPKALFFNPFTHSARC